MKIEHFSARTCKNKTLQKKKKKQQKQKSSHKVCDQYILFSAGFCIVKNMERKALYRNFSFIHIIQSVFFKNNVLAFLFSSLTCSLSYMEFFIFLCFVGCLQIGATTDLSTQMCGFFSGKHSCHRWHIKTRLSTTMCRCTSSSVWCTSAQHYFQKHANMFKMPMLTIR